MITKEQASICAEFLLDELFNMSEYNLLLPYPVAVALRYYVTSNKSMCSLFDFRNALQGWLDHDSEACVAMLGPGLELA